MIPKKRRRYNISYYWRHRERLLKRAEKYRKEHKKELHEYYLRTKEKNKQRKKETLIIIPTFYGNKAKGQTKSFYTDGMAKHITKEMIDQIKNKVFEDCIDNPGKFLE